MKRQEFIGMLMTVGFTGLTVSGINAIFSSTPYLSNSSTISFEQTVKPVIQTRCTPCHTGQLPSLPNFTEYDTAFKKRISIKHKVWTTRLMPPGGGTITEDERRLIRDWVDQGGKK